MLDIMVDGALISNTENGVRIKTWQVMYFKQANNSGFLCIKKKEEKVTEI